MNHVVATKPNMTSSNCSLISKEFSSHSHMTKSKKQAAFVEHWWLKAIRYYPMIKIVSLVDQFIDLLPDSLSQVKGWSGLSYDEVKGWHVVAVVSVEGSHTSGKSTQCLSKSEKQVCGNVFFYLSLRRPMKVWPWEWRDFTRSSVLQNTVWR